METLVGIGLGLVVSASLLYWGWWHYYVPYRDNKIDEAVKHDQEDPPWGV